jgi:hypothetical protein
MRSILIVAVASAVAVTGCTFKSTTVERPAPVVYTTPAPAVVYQAPAPTVVYQAPPPVVRQPIEAPPSRTVSVTYTGGLDGFELAVQKANRWCGDNFGNSAARMVTDDRATGHATFNCIEL